MAAEWVDVCEASASLEVAATIPSVFLEEPVTSKGTFPRITLRRLAKLRAGRYWGAVTDWNKIKMSHGLHRAVGIHILFEYYTVSAPSMFAYFFFLVFVVIIFSSSGPTG